MDAAALAHLRHELRTPLNHIIGYSELLLEETPPSSAGLLRDLQLVHDEARQVLQVINDLLGAPRLDAGSVDLAALPLAVASPLGRILVTVERMTREAPADARPDVDRIGVAARHLETMVREGVPAPASDRVEELTEAAEPSGPVDAGVRRVAAAGRILVVDDNEDNRHTLVRRLGREGYTDVTAASSGARALELLRDQPFDLVLLDILMPGLNGYEVLERLKADPRQRDVPVIMISALDEIESVVRCIELGAEDYLPKPFNPTLLRARVGATLEKKRLRDEVAAYLARIERELASAREIQLSMVPTTFPAPTAASPVEVFATLQPAREVGGDLYDVFTAEDGRLCFVVADVSDKGAPAALFMARTKTLIRLVATLLRLPGGGGPGPDHVIELVNRELCLDNPFAMFVTLFLGMLDPTSGELTYCNAGHTTPYLVRRGGAVTPLPGGRGKPLGVRATLAWEAAACKLAAGEGLFVYTDGITEAMDPGGALFTEPRLEEVLAELAAQPPRTLVAGVVDRVRGFAATAPQSDDIAALALRYRG